MVLPSIKHFSTIKEQLREISPELEEPDLSKIAAQLASTEALTDSIYQAVASSIQFLNATSKNRI